MKRANKSVVFVMEKGAAIMLHLTFINCCMAAAMTLHLLLSISKDGKRLPLFYEMTSTDGRDSPYI